MHVDNSSPRPLHSVCQQTQGHTTHTSAPAIKQSWSWAKAHSKVSDESRRGSEDSERQMSRSKRLQDGVSSQWTSQQPHSARAKTNRDLRALFLSDSKIQIYFYLCSCRVLNDYSIQLHYRCSLWGAWWDQVKWVIAVSRPATPSLAANAVFTLWPEKWIQLFT